MSNTVTTTPAVKLSLKVLDERMARMEALIAGLVTQLDAPAKTAPARKATTARKAPAKKASPKKASAPKAEAPATKGSQSRETLSRKDWNRTLTAKARLAGKVAAEYSAFEGETVYGRVTAMWAQVQELRATHTPDEVLFLASTSLKGVDF